MRRRTAFLRSLIHVEPVLSTSNHDCITSISTDDHSEPGIDVTALLRSWHTESRTELMPMHSC